MSEEETVLVERKGATTIISLNQPARKNPMGDHERARLLELLAEANADPEVRAIVLTGAGGQFSSGADMKQVQGTAGPDPARSRRRLKVLHDVVRAIAAGPKPVVAAVEGVAYGAGLSIVAACDWVIVAEGARMGAAFARIGLAPDTAILWSLPQRIGAARTKDLIFTGNPVLADEALRIGLAEELVGQGKALERALEKAEEYLSVAPLSIAATKAALSELPGDIETALRIEAHQQPMLSMTQDHQEARSAFLEKRKPTFIGR